MVTYQDDSKLAPGSEVASYSPFHAAGNTNFVDALVRHQLAEVRGIVPFMVLSHLQEIQRIVMRSLHGRARAIIPSLPQVHFVAVIVAEEGPHRNRFFAIIANLLLHE